MIDAKGIAEIIATYEKYGWILRRVLLTKDSNENLNKEIISLFGNAKIVDSEIDAAWFSRPPKKDGVAWELRFLGSIPFALLENIDETDPEFENILSSVELRLRKTISEKIQLDNGAVR